MSGLDWLSDEAWAVIESHLPKNRSGAHRVDDRRVISGILHVLRSGCRWSDCPPEYGPATTIYNRYNRWSTQGIWRRIFERLAAAGNIPDEISIDSTHVKAHRSAAGAQKGAKPRRRFGRSRGGRTSKVHAVANAQGRPLAFVLTPGNIADISVAATLLGGIATPRRLLADKAYDVDHLRQPLEAQGTEVVIPSNGTRRRPYPLNRPAYRRRNLIERMFGRMKDWRCFATRYDRLARNFLSTIAIVATACFWLS
ncbi:IS5 family transposase [Rhodovarius crocodyli]|uniref:IS5 family transposase n=1 Tax=Rhodovarius crocodyli TaxID=1979269 RepID=A0A437LV13_9PROT|nr:IS5 family transposase [Rhodovarius crocodyli]RVT89275.1 IS5 family transposase [Rhodovarius crocodyli]